MMFQDIESNYKNEIVQMIEIIGLLDRLKSTADKTLAKEIEKMKASFSEKIQKVFDNIEPNSEGIKVYHVNPDGKPNEYVDINYAFTGLVKAGNLPYSIFLLPFDFTVEDANSQCDDTENTIQIPYNDILKITCNSSYSRGYRTVMHFDMSDMIRKYIIYKKTGLKTAKPNAICTLLNKINAFIASLENTETSIVESFLTQVKSEYQLDPENRNKLKGYNSSYYNSPISKIFETYAKFLDEITNNFTFCLNYNNTKIPYVDEDYATTVIDLFEDQYKYHKNSTDVKSMRKNSQKAMAIYLANNTVCGFCEKHPTEGIAFSENITVNKSKSLIDDGAYHAWTEFVRKFHNYQNDVEDEIIPKDKAEEELDKLINDSIIKFNHLIKDCCSDLKQGIKMMTNLQKLLAQIPDKNVIQYLIDSKMITKEIVKEIKTNAKDKK